MRLAALLLTALPAICACGSLVGVNGTSNRGGDGSNDPSAPPPSQASTPPATGAPTPTAPPPAPTPSPSKLAFVTSLAVPGTDTTKANADGICTALAAAAGFAGTFAAWLSDGRTSAGDADVVKPGMRYVRPDGLTISSDLAAAIKAKVGLENAIAVDDQKMHHDGASVWTFTNDDGRTGQTCAKQQQGLVTVDFGGGDSASAGAIGTLGTVTANARAWTEAGTSDKCDEKKPIYCFEQ